MANRTQFKLSTKERILRNFSEEFKQQKVREVERKQTKVSEICKQYEVSATSVNRWLKKYSSNYMKGIKTIVETESDTKKLIELQAKIADLERIVGQKQLVIDFRNKVIELAEQTYGVDIKKKLQSKPFSGTGTTESD
ncbi:MAG TPA: transposase [Hanamia sp.]|nr:transposase [Hanamia sp.]